MLHKPPAYEKLDLEQKHTCLCASRKHGVRKQVVLSRLQNSGVGFLKQDGSRTYMQLRLKNEHDGR